MEILDIIVKLGIFFVLVLSYKMIRLIEKKIIHPDDKSKNEKRWGWGKHRG